MVRGSSSNLHTTGRFEPASLMPCCQLQRSQHTCHFAAGFIHELNNNKGLYSALLRALDRHEALTKTTYLHSGKTETSPAEGFTREAVVVGKLLKRDFEMAGIHLEAHKQEEFTQLTASIHQTGFSIGLFQFSTLPACALQKNAIIDTADGCSQFRTLRQRSTSGLEIQAGELSQGVRT